MTTIPKFNDIFSPTNYNLSFDLSKAAERSFSGLVDITGELLSGETISLHAKDLRIKTVLIDGKMAQFSLHDMDELRLTHADLKPGEHIITISFSGRITDAMHGIYPCYYEHEGQKREIYATQFESHHAREAFPCVDEPAAKATFELTLTTDKTNALSNMPIRKQYDDGEQLVTAFEVTPRMSSYLLAFVVGDLHRKTTKTKSGVEINAWATPAQSPTTLDVALDFTKRSVEFFEDYLDVKYPLPKLDSVALPDFAAGAMENWGLMTFRESCMLFDPLNSSESSKRYIATVIAHEVSHQWFGNLVTMNWWNDIWLNESFATMTEHTAVDALEPDWHIWEDFATSDVAYSLRRDSLNGVQAIKTDVNHPDEIGMLLDGAIVYIKGARLMKMVNQLIGDEAFRTGLKSYFQKFAYKNAVGDDLWHELEQASQKPIGQLMSSWISQPGLPLVSVERHNGQTTISQQRFFIGEGDDQQTIWPIPLFADNDAVAEILTERQQTFETDDVVFLNKNLSAHFVSQYDDESYAAILEKVKSGELSTLDKICLLQDALLLTRAGKMPSAKLLPIAMTFTHESNEKVYRMAVSALVELRKFVELDSRAEQQLKAVSVSMAKPTFDQLGWEEVPGESDDDRERRSLALGLLVYGEQPEVLAEVKRRFELGLDSISPEIRSLVLSAVVRHHENPDLIQQLFDQHQATNSGDLQLDICLGLTSSQNPTTIDLILKNIKNPEIIRPQDASAWFVYTLRNRHARKQAWQWLMDNWSWIENKFGGDKSYDAFVRYTASSLMTAEELAEFEQFFAAKKEQPALTRVIELGIKEITARVDIIQKDGEAVRQALADYL